jgi:pyrimidine operon attenuation protein / uracil phosphoribosyltransferase
MKKYILDQQTVSRKLHRMALEIIENNIEEQELVLVGIREHGSVIAREIQQILGSETNLKTSLVHLSLDKKNPGEIKLSEEIEFAGKVIIVIDDVANSGKTMLYALQPLLSGKPKKIQTLALVERTHKAFPVKTDYVGISLATTVQDHIFVEVAGDVVTGAYIV